jgi:hypothetical protein
MHSNQCTDNGADHDREALKKSTGTGSDSFQFADNHVADAVEWPVVHVENFDDTQASWPRSFR